MRGILDRFEGDQAVILMEEEKTELLITKDKLPPGSEKNTIFKLRKKDNHYEIQSIDLEATKQARATSSSLMDQLRAKSKGSKFKK